MSKLSLLTFLLAVATNTAIAGFGGMTDVGSEHDGSSGSGGFVAPGALVSAIFGAFVGYRLEQAFHRSELRQHGATDSDLEGMEFGGKVGAAIGAILGPLLFHLVA
ncbi:hypothetical protein ACUTR7_16140 [Delftia sp. NA_296.1]|uniref:hypothetical protein n=1 Tax=Delftia sp. NA_296.1 TaxID=3415648 RepID=UPI004046188A